MTPVAAARSPQSSINPETRLKLYRTMQECRMLEKRAYDLFMQNLIKGTSHLALGQEAVAAGFGQLWVVSASDRPLPTSRTAPRER